MHKPIRAAIIPTADGGPAQTRAQLNELLDYRSRCHGDARVAASRQVLAALARHPWLSDQVPYDVRGLCVQDVRREVEARPRNTIDVVGQSGVFSRERVPA